MKYDLAIAHRVCPILAKTADRFTDKYKMVEATTTSLANALAGIRVKLVVILDGCPSEYERLFNETFGSGKVENVDYSCISTPSIGNNSTYARQLEILSAVALEARYLYFSEDDYIYKDDAFVAMMDFLNQDGVDFVTPLDHPDGYQRDRESSMKSVVRVSKWCHWKEISSTCCTFMLKSDSIERAKKSLSYYADGGTDFIMGLLLTKKGVYSLSAVFGGILKYLFGRPHNWMTIIPALAWFRLGPRLMFAPCFRLWSPLPTLAVHLCTPSLPPFSRMIYKEINL